MNGKIIAGASVGLVIGLVFGILIGLFLLPNLIGGTGLIESDYVRITVFSGSTATHDFGDYNYIFFYKVESYYTKAEEGIVVSVRGIYQSIPSIAGSTHTVLDLRIIVSEVHDDYVVLLAKLA